jgi:hypothetical protein
MVRYNNDTWNSPDKMLQLYYVLVESFIFYLR